MIKNILQSYSEQIGSSKLNDSNHLNTMVNSLATMLFDRFDLNEDGTIDKEEFCKLSQVLAKAVAFFYFFFFVFFFFVCFLFLFVATHIHT